MKEESEAYGNDDYSYVVDLDPDAYVRMVSYADIDGRYDFEFTRSSVVAKPRRKLKSFREYLEDTSKVPDNAPWADYPSPMDYATESSQPGFQKEMKTVTFTPLSGVKVNSSPEKASVSKKSAKLPLVLSRKKRKQVALSQSRQTQGLVLQSGVGHRSLQQQNDSPSSPRPENIEVLVILLTRRQERLYNRICHTRRFQQALRAHPSPSTLRRNLLDFVMSSNTASIGNPLQDFLGAL
jgi:hypothetical protein